MKQIFLCHKDRQYNYVLKENFPSGHSGSFIYFNMHWVIVHSFWLMALGCKGNCNALANASLWESVIVDKKVFLNEFSEIYVKIRFNSWNQQMLDSDSLYDDFCGIHCLFALIRKQVTMVFPCVKMDEVPEVEKNRSLEGVRTAVGGFLQGLPVGAQAHSFRYGQVCVRVSVFIEK